MHAGRLLGASAAGGPNRIAASHTAMAIATSAANVIRTNGGSKASDQMLGLRWVA